MKKTLLSFTIAAGIAATLLSGCGKDPVNTAFDYNGSYKGAHRVNINNLDVSALVDPIQDTLRVTKTPGNPNISVYSAVIGRTLTGTLDTVSGIATLDSLIFDPTDTLKIASTTVAGGVRIWGVRAGGSGKITTAGVLTTSIKIKKGFSNINIAGFDLTNLSTANLELKGTFNK